MIGLTVPGFGLHGGIRVLLEWANRLDDVIIFNTGREGRPDWFNLNPSVKISRDVHDLQLCDTLIIGSPHGIYLQHHRYCPSKVFVFLQMMEHLFQPTNKKWQRTCQEFYLTEHPMILGAHWNYVWCKKYGRTAPTYYVGNGVNLDDFPITTFQKSGNVILLESPVSANPAKDTDRIALKVAALLKKEGYQILGYGANTLQNDVFDAYYDKPTLTELNMLYLNATLLLKATHYDARALAPMEAMTKACVTARAIDLGDDDLIHNVTAMRCSYDEDALYFTAKALLSNHDLRERLAKNCVDYVQRFSWDYWIPKIKNILNDTPDKDSIYENDRVRNGIQSPA